MMSCPTCNKPVDPLRARAVGVRDGKVVAYCSTACQQAAESRPTILPASPTEPTAPIVAPARPAAAKPAPRDHDETGPVIEILHEPSSGVVTSARDERVPTAPVVASPAAESDDDDAAAEDDDEEGDDDQAGEGEKRFSWLDKRDARPSEADGAAEADEPGAPSRVTPTSLSDAAVAAQAESKKSPGKVTLNRRRDSFNARSGFDWIDDEPAEVRPGTNDLDVRSRGRGIALTLFLLALLGGGGYLVYRYVYLERVRDDASTASTSTTPGAAVAATSEAGTATLDGPPPSDASAVSVALDRSLEVLRDHLDSKSPRVQRMAAMALSRTGDATAIETLATILASPKTDDSTKPEVAFALARAGDKRGSDALVAMLGSPRRDDKLAAGRLLLRLRDERAVAVMASYLDVAQHRLSVAEALAAIREPRALEVLEDIRANDKSSPDEKARATIALGLAGKAEVAGELRPLLEDTRFNAFAAEALAALADEAARPVLKKQLEVPSLRVGAARALKRLDPSLDPVLYLEGLAGGLGTAADPPKNQKDTDQISLAETILLLAGPASWSERS